MNRFRHLHLLVWFLSVLGQGEESLPRVKPNFVVIFVDDMGFADPGCFGNPLIKTPEMDRLAEEGLKLTAFYVNSPICSASRVALLTGQYPGRWRIHSFLNTRAGNANRGMADFLDAKAPTTAKKLKAAGYATAHFGKWHMGGGRDVDDAPLPQAYGFDESLVSFEGLGDRIISNPRGLERAKALGRGKVDYCERWDRIKVQTNRTIDFIRRHHDRPFYVRLFPNDVHDRHDPKPGAAAKYSRVSNDPFLQNFLAVLEEMDRQIGRVVAEVDRLGMAERTLIVLTSDNGPTDWPRKYRTGPPAGFTGPYRGRKWSLFEGGIRMPFIARWKGMIPAGTVDHVSLMAAIDVSPTLCRLAGVPFEDQLDGVDRSEVLLGRSSERSGPVYWQYGHPHALLKGGRPDHQSPTFAMREGRWKFLVNPDGSEAQLFDLIADPGEQVNRLRREVDRASLMRRQLTAWAQDVGFDIDGHGTLSVPKPTVALWAGNQLLRFVDHGVEGDRDEMRFSGEGWLALPAFRAPKIAGGRSLMIRGTIEPLAENGVIFSHGERENGYAVYLEQGHLHLVTSVDGRRRVLRSRSAVEGAAAFQAQWRPEGQMILRVGDEAPVVGDAGQVLRDEPTDSIEVGSDHGSTVGDYMEPGFYRGILRDFTFRYPNGT